MTVSTMNNQDAHIPVGSGYCYIAEYDGQNIPADTDIEVEGCRLGYVKQGAEITYTPTYQKFTDDYGLKRRTILTGDEGKFNCEFNAWSSVVLDRIAGTARVTETTGKRTVKIGGMKNDSKKRWVMRFVHPDAEYGDVRVTMVGVSTAELKLNFKPEEEGKLAYQLDAEPLDADGTLILYDEEIG